MCGFLGRVIKSPAVPALSGGLRFLHRRGPDSNHHWTSTDSRVELLHARLAIVDSDSRARQPFTDELNGVTVVFNGEIYNYRELRAEIADYEFRTQSDTEVITALYVTRGISGLKRLRGMFGIAIVDERARRIYLARDPIGKKPLFLTQWADGTYFGSSVMAMLAASDVVPEIRSEQLENFWSDGHSAPDDSLVQNCAPVAPGQVLELNWQGDVLRTESCTPEFSTATVSDLTDVRNRIRELITQGVNRRLLNNPNPVSLLSGGVDSTVVSGSMKAIAGGSAITLGSFLPGTNDEKYARFAGKRLELPLQVVRARTHDLVEDVDWAMDLQDEPLGMISFFPLAMMIRAAKDYGKILLTGDGGDEVFLGYGMPQDWIVEGSTNQSEGTSQLSPPGWMSNWGKNMLTRSLVGHMFTKLDRASAEQGVETRCPLLDVDLIAFVRSLDPQTLFFDGRAKALLKDQLNDWPDGFVHRPKMGFTFNLRWQWARTRFAGLREMVTTDALETFESYLPMELKRRPVDWTTLTIFRNFADVWKLIAWSKFLERLSVTVVNRESHRDAVEVSA
jgi:asparagine synthase (glutamine-hydrolysing)